MHRSKSGKVDQNTSIFFRNKGRSPDSMAIKPKSRCLINHHTELTRSLCIHFPFWYYYDVCVFVFSSQCKEVQLSVSLFFVFLFFLFLSSNFSSEPKQLPSKRGDHPLCETMGSKDSPKGRSSPESPLRGKLVGK